MNHSADPIQTASWVFPTPARGSEGLKKQRKEDVKSPLAGRHPCNSSPPAPANACGSGSGSVRQEASAARQPPPARPEWYCCSSPDGA